MNSDEDEKVCSPEDIQEQGTSKKFDTHEKVDQNKETRVDEDGPEFQNETEGARLHEKFDREDVPDSAIENDSKYVSEVMYEGSGGSGCENRIFARFTEDGFWLLRWDVRNKKEDDFVALCYQGIVKLKRITDSKILPSQSEDNILSSALKARKRIFYLSYPKVSMLRTLLPEIQKLSQ